MPEKAKQKPIAVLILAHNESDVIEKTVMLSRAALSSKDSLFVVADYCTDDTKLKAKNAGAKVLLRNKGSKNSKGAALFWFIEEMRDSLHKFSRVTILDADSIISPEFITNIKENIVAENELMQTFVYPQFDKKSPVGTLAALSELHDQHISDKIRTKLGWAVRLRGTGMVISPHLLLELKKNYLETQVEDIALSLIFTAKGIRTKRLDIALLLDPKPSTVKTASNQRARWFRGQQIALWQYHKEIMRVFLQGPAGWSLLSSLFLKPKWLMLVISLLLTLVTFPIPPLSFFFGLYFTLGLIYLFIGLCLIPERSLFFRTLLHIPAYIWMWLKGIYLSLRTSSWLRARD
ncbi:MAG: glycosyltransferase [Anaerolineae bacterium]|jgi:cellulose synthase/poly-beta-1,6-N-acetylglucosamine synthase-like glycosyltransferase|nr:glycosyltransferase [Anaerolineae bacterium]